MAQNTKKKIAFISTFQPRKCGIATFCSDLIDNISLCARDQFEPIVIAMRSGNELTYREPVKFEIRQEVKNDYICAADYINFSHVDAVCVQHEFGLYGGQAGTYLDLMLSRLNAPIITILHTVLDDPSPDYYQSMIELCNTSYHVVTMNTCGIQMLRDIYDVPENKIKLIAHGIPDLPFVDSNYYKHKFSMEQRKTILTFGLLSKNKGIEVMLRAMPEIIKADPSVLYVILGMTHPLVKKHDGESYRFSLQNIVKELGLTKNVIFHDRFVKDEELHNFLCASDLYVTPYLNREQLTSGTLSFAVGSGKAVISTPYWAAEELLSGGRGVLVPFNDHKKMAKEIIDLLKDEKRFYELRRKAYEYGRSRTWQIIGQKYWEIFSSKSLPVRVNNKPQVSEVDSMLDMNVPEPSLAHMKKMTDDTGLFQHAKHTIPNRLHGYTTDDNARALMVMNKYYNQYSDPEALRLFDIYLSFTMYSQEEDGSIHNLMDYDRNWVKNEPPHDSLGRFLWALGSVMACPSSPSYLPLIKEYFDNSVSQIDRLYPRSLAYAVLGLSDYLKQFPGASDIKRSLANASDQLLKQYDINKYPDWPWFEDILTYDNAVLPHALFVASKSMGQIYLKAAVETCDFLIEQTYNGTHFSFIGCNGWYERNGEKAKWDQQPIEAAGTIMMLHEAYEITKEKRYLSLQRKAFDWFLGANDLHLPVYDFRTKGCHDGLTPTGINLNQGAESTLCFLLAILTVIESYSVAQKILKNSIKKKDGLTELLKIAEIKAPTPKSEKTQELK